eukprot:SAG11_NODE_7521_length_1135_cov_1.632239_1_plen_270_part_00
MLVVGEASLRQQIGRAGRRGRAAVGIVVTYDSPVDAYFLRHPEQLLPDAAQSQSGAETSASAIRGGLPHCSSINPYLLGDHLICAAAELPLRLQAPPRPGNPGPSVTEPLADAELDAALFGGGCVLHNAVYSGSELRQAAGGSGLMGAANEHGLEPFVPAAKECDGISTWKSNAAVWSGSGYQVPHQLVSIRAVGATFSVVCTRSGRQLETVEAEKAFFSLYVGSLFQHQVSVYRVVELAISERVAYAVPLDPPRPDYITQPLHNLVNP